MSKIDPIEAKKISLHAKLTRQQSNEKKTALKSYRGDVISLEHYLTKENITLSKLELKIKDLPLDLAETILDIVLPLFNDPYEQQSLDLEVKTKTMDILPEKEDSDSIF